MRHYQKKAVTSSTSASSAVTGPKALTSSPPQYGIGLADHASLESQPAIIRLKRRRWKKDSRIRKNQFSGKKLGWAAEIDAIIAFFQTAGYLPEQETLDEAGFALAVAEFQKKQGLAADGILGPKTWASLHGELDASSPEKKDNTLIDGILDFFQGLVDGGVKKSKEKTEEQEEAPVKGNFKSFEGQSFEIASSNKKGARIRNEDLSPKRAYIPNGTMVEVEKIRIHPTSQKTFALVQNYGWTSTDNFVGKLIGETIGIEEAPDLDRPDKEGDTALWQKGKFVGNTNLVYIVGRKKAVVVSIKIADPLLRMIKAAASAGIRLRLNSGFRTFASQDKLYQAYIRKKKKYKQDLKRWQKGGKQGKRPKKPAPAASPGKSNHQSGLAVDINTGGYDTKTYQWLKEYAPGFGFIRTVRREPWHWVYLPNLAKKHGHRTPALARKEKNKG